VYQLTHNGHPIGKPHPHRITCYIEAVERGLIARGQGRYWAWGVKIEQVKEQKK